MIRTAIVGIGHWGRTLVNAVQGNSDKIRFTAGQTRTRAKAAAFCAEQGIALYDDLSAILADPTMQFEAEAKHEAALRHAIDNREGSMGGTGVAGGGCGCN